jgi:hypothetical protein
VVVGGIALDTGYPVYNNSDMTSNPTPTEETTTHPTRGAIAGLAFTTLLPLVLLAFFAAAGCSPPPPPEGRWVNGDKALAAVLTIYMGRQPSPSELAQVYVVPVDEACAAQGKAAFLVEKDKTPFCVAGMTLGRQIWLAEEWWLNSFSSHLPHEAMHLLGVHHDGAVDYAPGSLAAKQIAVAEEWLRAHPDVDHIAEDPRQ